MGAYINGVWCAVWPDEVEPADGYPAYGDPMTQTPETEPTVDVPVETPAKDHDTVEVPADAVDPVDPAPAPDTFEVEVKESPRT